MIQTRSFWLLIGLPGSGKSTWAQHFLQGCPNYHWVSTDQIRAQLYGDEAIQGDWLIIWQRVEAAFSHSGQGAGASGCAGVVYDATNTRRRDRRAVIQSARNRGFTRILAVWFDVPLACCLARNRARSRQVPEAVIDRMARQLAGTEPTWEEGFDAVFRLRNDTVSSVESLL